MFIVSWIRRKIIFALENSLCACLRGSRSVYYTSNTNAGNSFSSFANVGKVTSNVTINVQRYYPFEFHILHTLHATTALNVT